MRSTQRWQYEQWWARAGLSALHFLQKRGSLDFFFTSTLDDSLGT